MTRQAQDRTRRSKPVRAKGRGLWITFSACPALGGDEPVVSLPSFSALAYAFYDWEGRAPRRVRGSEFRTITVSDETLLPAPPTTRLRKQKPDRLLS